jgi:arabinose-5-phosphate isomerase
LVAFTSHAGSDLAQNADFHLLYQVPREACPLELAPTSSTTAALALGDALAMVLLQARGLTRDDFAKYHPAGNIGALLLKVRDIMRTADRLPIAPDTVTTQEAILEMTRAKSGSIALVSPKTGKLTGILTDGDFRRSALTGPDFLRQPVATFMTRSPKTVRDDALGVDALRLFEAYKIDDLIVINPRGQPVGLIDGQDLPKLKIV